MGDYYGGYGNGNNSGNVTNFSVPPPNFQNYPNQSHPPQRTMGQQQQQPGNWGPPSQSRDSNSGGYGSQGRSSSRGGGFGGGSQRNDYNADRKNSYSGGSGSKSGYNKGSDSGNDMIIQEDTIFVSGMNPQSSEDDIANHFGAIGIIKKDKKTMKPKIWLYRNKETGESKGEATITYDDSDAAKSAISWFHNKNFNGSTIQVSLAQRQNNWQKASGFRGNKSGGGGGGGPPRGGSRGGFDRDSSSNSSRNDDRRGPSSNQGGGGGGGGGGRNQREGDWTCGNCSNTNFAWRNECNRCKEPKSDGPGSGGGSSGGGGSYRNPPNRGSNQNSRGDFNRGPMRNDRGNDRNRPY